MGPERSTNQGFQAPNEGGAQRLGLRDRVARYFAERDQRTQGYLLSALDSLTSEGLDGASGYQIAKRDAELRHPDHPGRHMMGYGTIYRSLDQLIEAGQLSRTWVDVPEGPRRPIYRRVEQPSSEYSQA